MINVSSLQSDINYRLISGRAANSCKIIHLGEDYPDIKSSAPRLSLRFGLDVNLVRVYIYIITLKYNYSLSTNPQFWSLFYFGRPTLCSNKI